MLLGLVLCTVLGVVRAAAPLPVTEASWLAVASGSDVTSTRACTAASAAPGAKWTLPLLTPGQSNAEANDLWLIDPSKCSLDLLGAPHSRAQGCTGTLIEETVYGLMPDVAQDACQLIGLEATVHVGVGAVEDAAARVAVDGRPPTRREGG